MTPAARPVLALRGVGVRFGGVVAVDDLTLAVAPGSVVALVGANGAGKSTVLRTVDGRCSPTTGRVLLAGADVTGMPPHRVRRAGVGTVPQTPRPLVAATTRQGVALGAMFGTPGGRRPERAALAAADDALRLVGLDGLGDRPAGTLNLHEQRLAALAGAVAGRPRLLLLDEVMAGLTPAELAAALQVVRDVREHLGAAVVFVEHVMSAVQALADRVVVLHQGRVLADGPPAQVVRDDAVVAAWLGDRPGDTA